MCIYIYINLCLAASYLAASPNSKASLHSPT